MDERASVQPLQMHEKDGARCIDALERHEVDGAQPQHQGLEKNMCEHGQIPVFRLP